MRNIPKLDWIVSPLLRSHARQPHNAGGSMEVGSSHPGALMDDALCSRLGMTPLDLLKSEIVPVIAKEALQIEPVQRYLNDLMAVAEHL